MDEKRKILIIDDSRDRKTRIAALKERGYMVYPARKLAEARNRCKPGSYHLIVVNAGEDQDAAVELCDAILRLAPKQPVMMMVGPEATPPSRDYLVPLDTNELAARVDSLLSKGRSAVETPASQVAA